MGDKKKSQLIISPKLNVMTSSIQTIQLRSFKTQSKYSIIFIYTSPLKLNLGCIPSAVEAALQTCLGQAELLPLLQDFL